jgi:hypothetical protein
MDFALIRQEAAFALAPFLDQARVELEAFGYALEIEDRSKTGAAVQQVFVKDESAGKLLHLNYRPRTGPMRKLRIKLEVDTNPPAGAAYAVPVLDFPFPAAVRILDLPSLFAGKLHALLCRTYLKGRDWYDFIWYTARGATINHALLSAALDQQGPWQGRAPKTDNVWCIDHLRPMIVKHDWTQARREVQRFVKPHELPSLELWTRDFFLRQCAKLGGAGSPR